MGSFTDKNNMFARKMACESYLRGKKKIKNTKNRTLTDPHDDLEGLDAPTVLDENPVHLYSNSLILLMVHVTSLTFLR